MEQSGTDTKCGDILSDSDEAFVNYSNWNKHMRLGSA